MSKETPTDPAQTLAEEIVERLIDEGLVSGSKLAEMLGRLTAGTAKAEDWGLWTELSGDETSRAPGEDHRLGQLKGDA